MDLLEPRAGDELERQLARYARVRLDPSPASVRRARGAVMAEAWQQHLRAGGRRAGTARRAPFATWSARRLGASLAAAILAGLIVGSVAFGASRAGGPLYEVRLAIETATLPTDPAARLEAELALAQTRLAEATEAAARADGNAIGAALAAYEDVIFGLEGSSGGPADRALEAVQFHRTVLLRLQETAPSQAAGALAHALERSSAAIDKLGEAGSGAGANPGGGSGNGDPGSNAGNPGARPTAKPGRTPDPAATPRPGRTPAPTPARPQKPNGTQHPKN